MLWFMRLFKSLSDFEQLQVQASYEVAHGVKNSFKVLKFVSSNFRRVSPILKTNTPNRKIKDL